MEKNVGKIKATSAKSRKSRNQRKTTHKEYGNGYEERIGNLCRKRYNPITITS
jgi:hypothetical protein